MKIGLVSVTIDAAYPMTLKLRQEDEFKVLNYLDDGLQAYVREIGFVNDIALKRMENILLKAQNDGVKKILMTCTVFTPFLKELQDKLKVPLFAADDAMLQEAALKNKKTAIFVTFEATLKTSYEGFMKYSANNIPDMYLIKGDLIKEIKDKSKGYELIVLAQISMAHLKDELEELKIEILSSPQSAINKLKQ